MRNESAAQPFEAELDRYVESIVLSQARALRDGGALATWMEQEAAGWRETITAWRNDMRQAPRGRCEAEGRRAQSRMVASALARADLLEQLAVEVREARPPRTRH